MMKIVLVLMVLLLIDKIQRQNKDFFVLNHRFKIIWFGDAIWEMSGIPKLLIKKIEPVSAKVMVPAGQKLELLNLSGMKLLKRADNVS
jgi:hypothetical protein